MLRESASLRSCRQILLGAAQLESCFGWSASFAQKTADCLHVAYLAAGLAQTPRRRRCTLMSLSSAWLHEEAVTIAKNNCENTRRAPTKHRKPKGSLCN